MITNKILSIQSRVASGYVGCNIADFIIQLHGIDVISVPTVMFSTHTGHDNVCGEVINPSLFSELIKGVEFLTVRNDISHIITGYFASKELLEIAYNYIKLLKKDLKCIYICDPVMGDYRTNGLYISKEAADFLTNNLIPIADIITPNQFELEYILGESFNTPQRLGELMKKDILMNKTVVATSVRFADTPDNLIETVIIKDGNMVRVTSNRVDIDVVGTGDLFTSLITAQLVKGNSLENAVKVGSNYISNVLNYLKNNNTTELNSSSIVKFTSLL